MAKGCVERRTARNWCRKHYIRWYRHGDPLVVVNGNSDDYGALHAWMRRHFPQTGRCENCAKVGKTSYASIGHTYTRNRDDWFELCARCHVWFDGRGGQTQHAYRRSQGRT